MITRAIGASQSHLSYIPSPRIDTVFVHRDAKGDELFSFSLGLIAQEATIRWEEIQVATPTGSTGTGIYKITGDLQLVQNDGPSIQSLSQHGSRLFEIHELYEDGRSIHSSYIDFGKRLELKKYADGVLLERFNNIDAHRSSFGVRLAIVDSSASPRNINMLISGATCEKIEGLFQPLTNFYRLFTKLNKAPTKSVSGGIIS